MQNKIVSNFRNSYTPAFCQLLQYLYLHNTPTNLNSTTKPNLQLEHKGDLPNNTAKSVAGEGNCRFKFEAITLTFGPPLPYPYTFPV